jgi:hypothetical protein
MPKAVHQSSRRIPTGSSADKKDVKLGGLEYVLAVEMAVPHCLHPNRPDRNVLLATVFPNLASLCGPVVNEAAFARTVSRLLNLALGSQPSED